MPIVVRVPTPLRRLTNGQGEISVDVEGPISLSELIERLEGMFPGVKERLLDENGEIRRFVNLYVNDEDVRFLQGVQTQLKPGDVLSIVPAIAGGL
ncbi:MoaD/ThiS family protein [Thermocrinis minervae]|uniref:Molybdopterin synthase sulfur carrier subunit n=1 Tax=Thermocrinis minervae TaxID=381751 RepID=A0A1M6QNP9_9AQUI|nr:MoaD/ThiS family protein [Thermocrinis minervae]SHK21710.1 molybdopterin synthase sulfur carrier subunit [Thermocrinis minervae]